MMETSQASCISCMLPDGREWDIAYPENGGGRYIPTSPTPPPCTHTNMTEWWVTDSACYKRVFTFANILVVAMLGFGVSGHYLFWPEQ